VVRNRANGHAFTRPELYLEAFCKRVGNVQLEEIKAEQVLKFLDDAMTSTITWRSKYQMLLRFFEFWSSRGVMPKLQMPLKRPRVRQTFVPHVFSRQELRVLLRAIRHSHNPIRSVEERTFRTLVLVLYGIGALVSEVTSLTLEDVDLREGLINIRSRYFSRCRKIPIGPEVREVLRKYISWRSKKDHQSSYLFVTKYGERMLAQRIARDFSRLRQVKGAVPTSAEGHLPRLHDLRYTFAVHRITAWIRSGTDLNRMLPALAAYMGQSGLGATDRYLQMTPERFRKELKKLSPGQANGRWRNNKALMEFLATL
jgi:integrase/recombinase XerD